MSESSDRRVKTGFLLLASDVEVTLGGRLTDTPEACKNMEVVAELAAPVLNRSDTALVFAPNPDVTVLAAGPPKPEVLRPPPKTDVELCPKPEDTAVPPKPDVVLCPKPEAVVPPKPDVALCPKPEAAVVPPKPDVVLCPNPEAAVVPPKAPVT